MAPTLTNEALPDGLGRLARGEIDAVFVVGCDSDKAVADFGKDGRFHVVAIPYAPPLRALYTPMRLTAHDRPSLIDANEKIDTIGVPMALLAIDAPPDSPRAGRLRPRRNGSSGNSNTASPPGRARNGRTSIQPRESSDGPANA